MRNRRTEGLVLLLAAVAGCSSYQRTSEASRTIWNVRIARNHEEIRNCKYLAFVDSTDSQRGCGLTVQPTTEECLRYQVRLAGGDTLLSRGLVGDAYDCSGQGTAARESSPVAPPPPSPSPQPTPTPTPQPAAIAPVLTTPVPAGRSEIRIVQSRETLRGCVYLDEMDLSADCPAEDARAACLSSRAARAGGNTVLVEDRRALIFSCKQSP